MWESLCNLQSEIETREQKIRESSNQEAPLSNEMVQSIINKWEEIQTTATTLRPALQVINYLPILFTMYIMYMYVTYMYMYVWDLHVHVYMGSTCTCMYVTYVYMYIWDLHVHVCK